MLYTRSHCKGANRSRAGFGGRDFVAQVHRLRLVGNDSFATSPGKTGQGQQVLRVWQHASLEGVRRGVQALGNNAIALLKDSSLISAIGLAELAYTARTVAGAYSRYWEPYLTISLMYWTLTLGLAWGVKKLEARYGRGDTR